MATCPDGLVVPGPMVSPASTVFTLAMLFWMFYGVSIGADLFMEAIETITSQEVLGSALETEWRTRYASEPWYDPSMPVAFAVPAGSLGYSVIVFSACAVVTLAVLFLRRAVLGFELGGPTRLAQATAALFVFLWLVYIVLSVMRDGAR